VSMSSSLALTRVGAQFSLTSVPPQLGSGRPPTSGGRNHHHDGADSPASFNYVVKPTCTSQHCCMGNASCKLRPARAHLSLDWVWPQPHLLCPLIRLKRIYNFLCSMLVYTPFALCFVYTLWRFYTFFRTNLLTRCHGVSSLFSVIFVF
jgi:hypothetical protein